MPVTNYAVEHFIKFWWLDKTFHPVRATCFLLRLLLCSARSEPSACSAVVPQTWQTIWTEHVLISTNRKEPLSTTILKISKFMDYRVYFEQCFFKTCSVLSAFHALCAMKLYNYVHCDECFWLVWIFFLKIWFGFNFSNCSTGTYEMCKKIIFFDHI